jgi:hypothetical protein
MKSATNQNESHPKKFVVYLKSENEQKIGLGA